MATFISPLRITTSDSPKAKSHILNLNNYPNWHYRTYAVLKKRYKEAVRSQLSGYRFEGRLKITFTLHRKDRRMGDRANVLAVHEKFFCDALHEWGCIDDDNDDYIDSSHYYTGEIDKDNPRVEIEIVELFI